MDTIKYSREKINQIKKDIYGKLLPYAKRQTLQIYKNTYELNISWTQKEYSIIKKLAEDLHNYAEIFCLSPEILKRCDNILKQCADSEITLKLKQLTLLANLFEIIEDIEYIINQKLKRCNVCKNDVFFGPLPSCYEEMRKTHGFMYWNADFLLESKENFVCPICKANDRERLMIAFLEQIQAGEQDNLRMLNLSPSLPLERYALGRKDIHYESTDLTDPNVTFNADLQNMELIEDEAYDIIICSHVLNHIQNDAKAMNELYRILKPQGVCLVPVPLIEGKLYTDEQWGCPKEENWRRFSQDNHCRLYGKRDFIQRLQNAGFRVNKLDKEWFGEEFYHTYGFDDLSVLYVATKSLRLKVAEDVSSQDMTLKELEQENKLLHLALTNLNNYMAEQIKDLKKTISLLSHRLDNIGYEINDPRFRQKLWYPQIMSTEETINEIVTHKKSIARFGDGEFSIIAGASRWKFQKDDAKLAQRLTEVLKSRQDNIIIGLGDFYGDLSSRSINSANGVRIYLTPEVRRMHYKLLNPETIYGDTGMSRNETWEGVQRQKKIWEGRDCVFIEGFQTRMGVGNDLFDNVKSIVRILCPSESAFDKYEDIYNEAIRQPKNKLMLIALGPTASVLAYDLAMEGFQAIDIGHADLSYEWMLRGKFHGDKTIVPYKYNNELVGGFIVEDIHDKEYEAQIIADFH